MAQPTEWEYKVVAHTDAMYDGSLESILNGYGDEGWELVLCVILGPNYWVFKREKG